ncbi:hypothetical protein C8R45DRAFT_1031457, partial [Mycena sanguinolenta]
AWCSSPPFTISSRGQSRWVPPSPLPPRWRGRREAGAGEEKEEIYGHSLQASYSHHSDATPPHPRAESSSSPPSRFCALVVPSASRNVVERVVLRVASDAEPQRCNCFLHRDSRPVVHVPTTATTAARCAWGDDEVIIKIGRGRGSRLEATVRVEIPRCWCAGLLLRFDSLSHVSHVDPHLSCYVPDPPPPSLEDARIAATLAHAGTPPAPLRAR